MNNYFVIYVLPVAVGLAVTIIVMFIVEALEGDTTK